ncbi:MAG: divergent PAP2 family protein [Brevinematales bacterium]|nr:divergent PAP2 family protein [Brevinematales bacterium]
MPFWSDLLANKTLIAALCAQSSSQGLKIIRTWYKEKKIRFDRVAVYGDFPSAHTAFITAGTLTSGMAEGWSSPTFALGVIFSAIVISDALVQRRAIEQTQKALELLAQKPIFDSPFRGHTWQEILSGGIVGLFWSLLITFLWPF